MHGWQAWLAALLLVAGSVRIFQVVLHEPLYGYANQSDMSRIQHCFGIWRDQPGVIPYEGDLSAPYRTYSMGGTRSMSDCYFSSEMLFVAAAMLTEKSLNAISNRPPDEFDIRTVGIIKGMAAIGAALFLTFFLWSQPPIILVNAAVFALILADPYNTLWMNTLYSEFAALLFGYVSTGLLYYLLTTESPKRGIRTIFVLSLFLLGLAKIQHALLPLVLGAIWVPFLLAKWRHEKKMIIALIFVSIAVLSIQKLHLDRKFHINAANATDTYMGAVLPAMQNPKQGISLLGLPNKCAEFIGTTWYLRRGVAIEKACPEVFQVSRLRLVGLILYDPRLVVNMLKVALPQTKAWIIPYLGAIEGANNAKPRMTSLSRYFSFASVIEELSLKQFLGIYFLMVGFWTYAVSRYILVVLKQRGHLLGNNLSTLWLIAGTVLLVVTFSAIFGDGYSEISKHVHLGYAFVHAFLLSLLLLPLGAIRLFKSRWRRGD